jgi:hypothetical protein
MPKLSTGDLRALLAAEKADALSAMSASKLSDERSRALDYYLGDMTRDMPAPEGRSKAVSTDVADTIEGLMPTLMDIFCGGDEVVRFEPVGPEDVAAAEQETDYVNHVFMQRNPGFLVLYSFIKDALLSKVGIVKVWWETREEFERETYLDLTEEQFAIIAGDPAVEIVEHTEKRSANSEIANSEAADRYSLLATRYSLLHDVTVETKRTHASARVEAVPPEEFGIARNARSIRDAGYVFHDVLKRQEELIAQGYDAEQIKALPSYTALANVEAQARDTVEERNGGQGDEGTNKANRLIRITEHYVRMDYEGDGKAALYRVTTASEQGDILTRDGEPDIVRADQIPFAAMTPVIITHRFFGRSVADLVMDIQRIKTALLRALLDNAYLANNPRTEVPESHATETTLDDLLVSRPGGIVRTKMPGGLSVIQHPDIGGHVFPLLQYQDTTREWRTGVSRQGQGVDPNALQNQVATIANQMFNAAQAKVKLIARIFAETGIRDLFTLLHGTIRKHGGEPATVRLRNRWVTIDPRDWKERNDMTVNQERAARASQHDHRRAEGGDRRRNGEPEEPLQLGQGADQARGAQERGHVLHAAGGAARSERPDLGADNAAGESRDRSDESACRDRVAAGGSGYRDAEPQGRGRDRARRAQVRARARAQAAGRADQARPARAGHADRHGQGADDGRRAGLGRAAGRAPDARHGQGVHGRAEKGQRAAACRARRAGHETGAYAMTLTIKHATLSNVPDEGVPGEIGPSEWNQAHSITGADPIIILATGQSNFTRTPAFTWGPADNCFVWNWDGVDGHVGTAFVAIDATVMNVARKLRPTQRATSI